MKLPRNETAEGLIYKLAKVGYKVSRQKGSHIRLEKETDDGLQHLTIPNHNPLRIGTVSAILRLAAVQLGKEKAELINELYGK